MANNSNNRLIKVLAIKAANTTVNPSQQIVEDPFKELYSHGVIEPPYPLLELSMLTEASDILQQCIDTYKANIPGFGWGLKYNFDYESDDNELIRDEADREWVLLEQFFNQCNPDRSFVKLNKMIIGDRETTGMGYLEVLPYGDGTPCGFEYIPSHTVRMSPLEHRAIMIKRLILTVDGIQEVEWPMRFRKFVQIRSTAKTWFKQFGDPRVMDRLTGEYVPEGETIPPDRVANSILPFKTDVSWSSYGVPRYMGSLVSMLGSRKAEELNSRYFDKGRHIPLAVVVENGMLTKKSFEELNAYMRGLEGVDNAHGFLLLEAEGLEQGAAGEQAEVKIKFERLVDVIQKDALFLEYSDKARNKVRSQFRLPGLYTGDSQDFTRATAYEAKKTTEEQVFQPEREELAHIYNNTILPALGIKYVSMYFKGPSLSDQREKSNALIPYINAGAATPNMLIDALGELLGKEFEPFAEEWGNRPLALSIRELELAAMGRDESDIEETFEPGAEPPVMRVGDDDPDEMLDDESRAVKSEVQKLQKTPGVELLQVMKQLRDDVRGVLEDARQGEEG